MEAPSYRTSRQIAVLGDMMPVVDRYLSAAVLGRYLIATEDHNFDTAAKPSNLKGKRHFHDMVFVMKVCGVMWCSTL